MILTENGLRLGKAELEALLAFSSTKGDSTLYGVHFKAMTPGDSADPLVKARATDGTVAVDAFGHNTLGTDQEWFVSREFLAGLLKLASSTHHVVLKFHGASLHEAAVEDSTGREVATFSWPGEGAATAQMSFGDESEWAHRLKLPRRQRAVKCLSLKIDALKLIAKLGAAAGVPAVDCFPPPQDEERLVLRAEGEDTTWVAAIVYEGKPEAE